MTDVLCRDVRNDSRGTQESPRAFTGQELSAEDPTHWVGIRAAAREHGSFVCAPDLPGLLALHGLEAGLATSTTRCQ